FLCISSLHLVYDLLCLVIDELLLVALVAVHHPTTVIPIAKREHLLAGRALSHVLESPIDAMTHPQTRLVPRFPYTFIQYDNSSNPHPQPWSPPLHRRSCRMLGTCSGSWWYYAVTNTTDKERQE